MNDEVASNDDENSPEQQPKTGQLVVADANSRRPTPRRFRLTNLKAVRRELAQVYSDGRNGLLPLPECCRLAYILSNLGRVLEVESLEARVRELERQEPNVATRN